MSEFSELPEETQDGILRGIEDVEAGRVEVIHVDEPVIPTLEQVRLAYIDREDFVAQVGRLKRKTDEEYGEEFDEFIEGIRAKAWLEGLEYAKKLRGELPLSRTEANHGISCSTCDDGGCPDCTDPS